MIDFIQEKNFLPEGEAHVNLKFPKNSRGVAIAVPSPNGGESIAACYAIPARTVSSAVFGHIGTTVTSGIREDPAVSRGLGSVCLSCLFFFKSL